MAAIEIFESLRRRDHVERRRDGQCLVQPLWLFRQRPNYTHVASSDEFCEELDNLRGRRLLALHISAHGDDGGLQFANYGYMPWEDLAEAIANADLDVQVLALSSCNALATSDLPAELEHAGVRIPWLIGPAAHDGIDFDDACAAYINFYRVLASWSLEHPRARLGTTGESKETMRLALDTMHASTKGDFRYYRWSRSSQAYVYNSRRHSNRRLLRRYEELAV